MAKFEAFFTLSFISFSIKPLIYEECLTKKNGHKSFMDSIHVQDDTIFTPKNIERRADINALLLYTILNYTVSLMFNHYVTTYVWEKYF